METAVRCVPVTMNGTFFVSNMAESVFESVFRLNPLPRLKAMLVNARDMLVCSKNRFQEDRLETAVR